MCKNENLRNLILEAKAGNSKALPSLLLSIQNDIFSLCLRNLFDQERALAGWQWAGSKTN